MSSRAQWIAAWIGIATAVLGVVFFIATQTISWRDIIVVAIGAVLGAMLAAFVSTWVFHSDRRKNTQAAEVAAAKIQATAEAQRESQSTALEHEAKRTKATSEAEAVRLRAEAEADAIRTRADADAAVVRKKADLLTALPTRRQRLDELHKEIALTKQNRTEAEGNAEASRIQAREALEYGFRDDAAQRKALAKNWRVNVEEYSRRLPQLAEERDELEAMTDEEFLSRQIRARGLG
jgi:uncharacterized membrane protein YqiK